MTRVRKLAMAISSWVCRNAPASAQEWGAASEGELEHIENDWEALRWAVGSTSVLFASRPVAAPVTSVEQVPRLARGVARIVWRRTAFCAAIVVFQVYWWMNYFARMEGWVLRTGCCLIVAALSIFAVQSYLRRWKGMPRGASGAALVGPLREELGRQRQFHSGGWLAMRAYALMPGLLLVCCGLWAHEKTVANAELALGSAVAMAVLATIGTKIQLRTAEGFQKQIDALDALGSSGDNAKA